MTPQEYDAIPELRRQSPEEIDHILDRATGDPSLRKIRISPHFARHKRQEILNFVRAHGHLETLELCLVGLPFTASDCSFVLTLIRAFLRQNKNATKLSVELGAIYDYNTTTQDTTAYLLVLAQTGVTHLVLEGFEASDQVLADMTEAFSAFKYLKNLELPDIQDWGPAKQDAIMKGLSLNEANMENMQMKLGSRLMVDFCASPNLLKIWPRSVRGRSIDMGALTNLLSARRGNISSLHLVGDEDGMETRFFPFQNAAFFSCLQSATFVTELHLGDGVLDASGGTTIKDFLTNNESLLDLCISVDGSAWTSPAFLSHLAEGLANNKGLVSLDLKVGDYGEGGAPDIAVVMRALAQASQRKGCSRVLETLVFRLVGDGVDRDNREMLCDILGPNCTLKTFVYHGGSECSACQAEAKELLALLEAVRNSPKLEIFDARHDLQHSCDFVLPLVGVLPKLPPQLKEFLISFERPIILGPKVLARFKNHLLKDMDANQHLTRVKFMPYCWDDRVFDTKLQSYCNRNKFNRTYSALRKGYLPLATLPRALELTKQKGNKPPQQPGVHTATLIYEGLQSVQGQVTLKEFAQANPSGGSEVSEGTAKQPVPARCDNNLRNDTGTGDHATSTKELKRKHAASHCDVRLCASCQEEKPLQCFSKNQRRKGSKGRCQDCVASN